MLSLRTSESIWPFTTSRIRRISTVTLVTLSIVSIATITCFMRNRTHPQNRYGRNPKTGGNTDVEKENNNNKGISSADSASTKNASKKSQPSGISEGRARGNDKSWCREKILRGLDYVIIYNAVPKSGSRTISAVARALFNHRRRKGQSIFIPYDLYRDEPRLRLFYKKHSKGPIVMRGHSLYTPMEGRQYVYINIIRDPVERYISHLHYSWYGDSNNVNKKNATQKRDINECVQSGQCLPTGYLPFFCGFHPNCSTSKNRWSLETAVSNLDHYLVVGLTEEMDNTILVIQKLLPDLFKGVFNEYKRNAKKMKKSYTTLTKQTPSEETVAKLKETMAQTYEFYDIVESRFHELKKCLGI